MVRDGVRRPPLWPSGQRHRGKSLQTITRDDLENYRRRVFAKDTLKVVAVGDIDADSWASMLDKVFGDLPAKAELSRSQ